MLVKGCFLLLVFFLCYKPMAGKYLIHIQGVCLLLGCFRKGKAVIMNSFQKKVKYGKETRKIGILWNIKEISRSNITVKSQYKH